MVDFDLLPERVKRVILNMLDAGERVRMCFIAKGSLSTTRDFIVISNARVFIVDERRIGGWMYANVKGNIPIADIVGIEMRRNLKDRMLGQASLSLKLEGYEYLIDKASSKLKRLLSSSPRLCHHMAAHPSKVDNIEAGFKPASTQVVTYLL